jgi:DNA repair photolyase
LLDFRGLWDAENPAVADIEKIRRKIAKLPKGEVIRLGGMTDCFAPVEKMYRNTYKTIMALNAAEIPYLIVTKSDLVADDMYMDIMRKDLAHIQVTLTCTDDEKYKRLAYEKAPLPSKRIAAIEKLQVAGFDVQVRLSPFIPEFIDFDVLNAIKCDKIIVEFLRINTWIRKWFDIDFSKYTVTSGGYKHLPLDGKIELLKNVNFPQISVCEDEENAWEYFKNHVNFNVDDCCNLRRL